MYIKRKTVLTKLANESANAIPFPLIGFTRINAKMIFELYDKIGTINGLIKELNILGINSPTGKPYWHKKSLQRVLTNKKYWLTRC